MARDKDDSYIKDELKAVRESIKEVSEKVSEMDVLVKTHVEKDERLYDAFQRTNDILAQNTDSLKEHMHRTDLAEKRTDLLEEAVKTFHKRLNPIETEIIRKDAVSSWKKDRIYMLAKAMGAVAAFGTLVYTILKALGKA